jgi:hypothetical protein
MERFMARVDTSGGPDACHPRSGANIAGYSCFSAKGWTGRLATRWLMERTLGRPLSRQEHVLHKCDNPPCVNLRHLYVGGHKRNMHDMINRDRYLNPVAAERKARQHCPHGHAYSESNTYTDKTGCRHCRRCRADRERIRRARQRVSD